MSILTTLVDQAARTAGGAVVEAVKGGGGARNVLSRIPTNIVKSARSAPRSMRNVTPTQIAKQLKRRPTPAILATIAAIQAAHLAMSPEARAKAMEEASKDDSNPLEKGVMALLNPAKAVFVAGEGLRQMAKSADDAEESQKSLEEAQEKAQEKASARKEKAAAAGTVPRADRKELLFDLGIGDGVAPEVSLEESEARDMEASLPPIDYEEELDAVTSELGEEPEEVGSAESALQANEEADTDAAEAEAAAAAPAEAEADAEAEVNYTEQAISLFKNTHGTSFDEKSSKDRSKLEDMKSTLSKNKGKDMTSNQFALQYYRDHVL
jgi:hypothetical protein